MKFSRLLALVLLPAAFFLTANSLHAQGGVAPASALGLHINTQAAGLQYALSPSIHLGVSLELLQGDFTTTSIGFAPYAKWLFEGKVNPYVQAGLEIVNSDTDGASESVTNTNVYGRFGLEYFINPSVGIYGDIEFLTLRLSDPSATFFGLYSGRAGLEWFFN